MTDNDDVGIWELAPHCCRTCLGRILVCDDLFRCSGCGARSEWTPNAICVCGVTPRADGTVFRCTSNPNRTAAIPSEIVVGWFAPAPLPTPSEIAS